MFLFSRIVKHAKRSLLLFGGLILLYFIVRFKTTNDELLSRLAKHENPTNDESQTNDETPTNHKPVDSSTVKETRIRGSDDVPNAKRTLGNPNTLTKENDDNKKEEGTNDDNVDDIGDADGANIQHDTNVIRNDDEVKVHREEVVEPKVVPGGSVSHDVHIPNTRMEVTYKDRVIPRMRVQSGKSCTHHKGYACITTNFGRLGNKMYQCAAVIGVAQMHNYKARVDSRVFEVLEQTFVMNSTIVTSIDALTDCWDKGGMTATGEGHHSSFDRTAANILAGKSHRCDFKMSGFMQSWMYFYESLDDVIKAYTFIPEKLNHAKESMVKITEDFRSTFHIDEQPLTYIGVHVRRGDMSGSILADYGQLVPPALYYVNAMKYFNKKYHNAVFIVATDDKTYCDTKLKDKTDRSRLRMLISKERRADLDMAVLTQCNHTIMSVGTFGLMASILSKGEVIYYKMSSKLGSQHDNGYSTHKQDYYMPYWQPMW